MAGLPSALLGELAGRDVRRIMCSGPDTILNGTGVAAMYPRDEEVARLLSDFGTKILPVSSEEELDSFTVGICIPAMLLNTSTDRRDYLAAMENMERDYPVYGPLRLWVDEVASPGDTPGDAILENVCTKGGITEAMTKTLRDGAGFEAALRRGVERGREITREITKNIESARAA
jgi:pyrroline-5-carboxylate reductase